MIWYISSMAELMFLLTTNLSLTVFEQLLRYWTIILEIKAIYLSKRAAYYLSTGFSFFSLRTTSRL